MQDWIGVLLALAGVFCRWRCGKDWKSTKIVKRVRAAGADVALILTGYGIYLLASPMWNDVLVLEVVASEDKGLTLSFAGILLVLSVIFSLGILFNRNKQSSC